MNNHFNKLNFELKQKILSHISLDSLYLIKGVCKEFKYIIDEYIYKKSFIQVYDYHDSFYICLKINKNNDVNDSFTVYEKKINNYKVLCEEFKKFYDNNKSKEIKLQYCNLYILYILKMYQPEILRLYPRRYGKKRDKYIDYIKNNINVNIYIDIVELLGYIDCDKYLRNKSVFKTLQLYTDTFHISLEKIFEYISNGTEIDEIFYSFDNINNIKLDEYAVLFLYSKKYIFKKKYNLYFIKRIYAVEPYLYMRLEDYINILIDFLENNKIIKNIFVDKFYIGKLEKLEKSEIKINYI